MYYVNILCEVAKAEPQALEKRYVGSLENQS